MFEDEASDSIIINYGERIITSRQMFAQIFLDLRWALLSVLLAAVMLRIGSGSTFMTFAGVFQIVVRSSEYIFPPLLSFVRTSVPDNLQIVLVGVCCSTSVEALGVMYWSLASWGRPILHVLLHQEQLCISCRSLSRFRGCCIRHPRTGRTLRSFTSSRPS